MRVASIAVNAKTMDVAVDTVNSISKQVDKVAIYFNPPMPLEDELLRWTYNFNESPDKVQVHVLPEDLGDLAVFVAIEDYPDAYIYTCSPHCTYAEDYCDAMMNGYTIGYNVMDRCDILTTGGKAFGEEDIHHYPHRFKWSFIADGFIRGQEILNDNIDIASIESALFKASLLKGREIDLTFKGYAEIQLYKWAVEARYKTRLLSTYKGRPIKYTKEAKQRAVWSDVKTEKGKQIAFLINLIRQ